MGFQKLPKTIFLIALLAISLVTLKSALAESNAQDFIKKSCKASSYPDLCYTSLAPFADKVKNSSEKLAAVSVSFCLSKVQPLKSHVQDLSKNAKNPKLLQSLKQCAENFGDTVDEIKDSIGQFKDIHKPGAISNVQTWMSAAMTYEDTCDDTMMEDAPDGPEKKDVVKQTDGVKKITIISLALINLLAKTKS